MKIESVLISTLMALLSVSLATVTVAFSVQDSNNRRPQQQQQCQDTGAMSRAQWLQTAGGAFAGMTMMVATATPAWAKDVDPALKGTKQDPEFEACLGDCMYECTKPKGMEQKSRKECLPECKAKCATTKAQMMQGTPIKN